MSGELPVAGWDALGVETTTGDGEHRVDSQRHGRLVEVVLCTPRSRESASSDRGYACPFTMADVSDERINQGQRCSSDGRLWFEPASIHQFTWTSVLTNPTRIGYSWIMRSALTALRWLRAHTPSVRSLRQTRSHKDGYTWPRRAPRRPR